MTVREIRNALGLTQDAFAAALGVPTNTLWRWEAGRNKPSLPVSVLLDAIEATIEAISDSDGDGTLEMLSAQVVKGLGQIYRDALKEIS